MIIPLLLCTVTIMVFQKIIMKAMEQVLGKEITPFESTGLQRVPLFIRVPGIEGGVNHEVGGQIDIFQPYSFIRNGYKRLCSIWYGFII